MYYEYIIYNYSLTRSGESKQTGEKCEQGLSSFSAVTLHCGVLGAQELVPRLGVEHFLRYLHPSLLFEGICGTFYSLSEPFSFRFSL